MELRTARSWGVPHSVIRHGAEGKHWTEIDRLLATALTVYEDSLHPDCGHPRDLTGNPDSEGWFVTKTWTCQACAALARYRDEEKDRTDGEVVYVENEMPPGLKLREWPRPSNHTDEHADQPD